MRDDSNNCSSYLFTCRDHCDQEQSKRFELFNNLFSSDRGTRETIIRVRFSNHIPFRGFIFVTRSSRATENVREHLVGYSSQNPIALTHAYRVTAIRLWL